MSNILCDAHGIVYLIWSFLDIEEMGISIAILMRTVHKPLCF